jgi:hypothetical protein
MIRSGPRTRTGVCTTFAVVLSTVGAVAASTATAASPAHSDQSQAVPCIPSVQGPIPSTATSKPYIPTAQQGTWPVADNYTVQEYFLSCTALGQSWTTRILIRRPKSPRQFSGTVVTEVPDGSIWTDSYYAARYEMSAGIVTAMVESVPSFLANYVIPSDPQRYATLHIPNVSGINYVIEAEIGALLKSGHDDALPGLNVKHVIFSGFSGSAAEVRGYITAEHTQMRMPGGGPIYDGYFPEQAAVGSDPQPIPDLDVPVVEIQGEREVINSFQRLGNLDYRRPDGPLYRLYEVAAQPHVFTKSGEVQDVYGNWVCDSPRGVFVASDPSVATQFDGWAIVSMGLRLLVRWAADGIPAPHAPRIELDGQTVVRDQFGNAAGGVRSSYVDAPFASYAATSINDPNVVQPGATCNMVGYQFRLPETTLRNLYPTHAAYASDVADDLAKLTRQGWVTPQDARKQLLEAVRADVP